MANELLRSHPQRNQIKTTADESQSILEKTAADGNDDGPLRKFLKVHIAFRCPCYICCGV